MSINIAQCNHPTLSLAGIGRTLLNGGRGPLDGPLAYELPLTNILLTLYSANLAINQKLTHLGERPAQS